MSTSTQIKYTQPFTPTPTESPKTQALINTLSLQPHPEGGYYVQTDKSYNHIIPNPFLTSAPRDPFAENPNSNPDSAATVTGTSGEDNDNDNDATRTAITYYLKRMGKSKERRWWKGV
ncbi:hypothetical protein AA313_de0200743 [Arthrobotrys entomopaga]|nr:hypothetical protein AA313_de0200743 [Arthrobotrys entomopaga]